MFITFEGIEGCGKSTQLGLAAQWLTGRGIAVKTTAEPGGTHLGEKIRTIVLNRGDFPISAEAELLLFAAARAQHVREVIIPALEGGLWVLCDRFTDATLAYQGFGRGLDRAFLRAVNSFSSHLLRPDLTLLFDLPVEAGLARARKRVEQMAPQEAEDRFEHEGLAFHRRVREGYLSLAAAEPARFRLIDGSAPIEAVQEEVRRHLAALL